MAEPHDFEALVLRARAEHEQFAPRPPEAALPSFRDHIARDEHRARRRVGVFRVLLGSVVAVAMANVIEPQLVADRTLQCVTRGEIGIVIGLPALAVSISIALVGSRSAGGQMLLRALLWSTAMLGALVNFVEPAVVPLTAAVAAIGCGGALLVLREHGLEPERYSGSFAPVAHRGVLTVMMILAVADAQTLISWTNGSEWEDPLPGLCGIAMVVGIVGLYRLRMWGLLLNVAMNAIVAGMAAAGWLGLPPPVVVLLCATAAVQLGLAASVLRSIRRGAPTDLPRWTARWGRPMLWAAIVSVMVAAMVGYFAPVPEDCARMCE
jgi:hypothetical protein